MGVLSPTEYGAMDLQEPQKIYGKVELLAQFGAKHLGNPCIDFFPKMHLLQTFCRPFGPWNTCESGGSVEFWRVPP